MDEMKIKLSTKFMRGMLAKIIKKVVSKKLGYQIDIQINKIELETVDGKIHLGTDVDVEMDNDEFVKIINNIGID